MPQRTTTQIVKALFKEPYNIRKLDSFIRYRMKRLGAEGVINQRKKSRKFIYSVDEEKVFFGEGVLRMNGVDVDMGYFIVVKKDDETVAKSLDDYERRIGLPKKIFSEKRI